MKKSWTRWIPAVIVPAVVIAGALIIPTAADASPRLPEKTPQQLLEFVAASTATEFSGTIEQSSNLGLPQLPSIGSPSSASSSASGASMATALDLLTASHTARVFVGANHEARVQVLDQLAERDVIATSSDVWTWDSKANTATHLAIPARSAATTPDPAHNPTGELAKTPAELAQQLLTSLDPSTTVTVSDTARVAGRPVYQLVLSPKSGTTLVGAVVLAVDSETGMPLAVTISAAGQSDPAFSVAFSSIDFAAPDASLFTFTPPTGATVTEKSVPAPSDRAQAPTTKASDAPKPTISGTGWSTIVALPAGSFTANAGAAPGDSSSKLLDQLLTPVAGGKVLQTSLVSVLIADDGRVFVGAVSTDQLLAAAAQ